VKSVCDVGPRDFIERLVGQRLKQADQNASILGRRPGSQAGVHILGQELVTHISKGSLTYAIQLALPLFRRRIATTSDLASQITGHTPGILEPELSDIPDGDHSGRRAATGPRAIAVDVAPLPGGIDPDPEARCGLIPHGIFFGLDRQRSDPTGGELDTLWHGLPPVSVRTPCARCFDVAAAYSGSFDLFNAEKTSLHNYLAKNTLCRKDS
jgi:hypothetical protein